MATTSAPYGIRPVNRLGAQSFAGATRLYAIPSGYAVSIQTGDPVIVTNTGSTRGTVARMNATTTATTITSTGGGFGFVGVFMGCTYTDPVFGKIFRQTYPAGTVASDIQAYVADDPDQVFQIQADEALNQTALGCNASLIQTVAGSSGYVASGLGLDASSIATANTLPLRIVDFVTIGDAFTDVLVRINTHFHRTGNTGSAGTAVS